MINIYIKGIFYYVQDGDVYIIKYLFNYKIKDNKLYFKNLNNVIYLLNSLHINYKYNNKEYKYIDNTYYIYLDKVKYINNIENILYKNILDRNFNKIYRNIYNIKVGIR